MSTQHSRFGTSGTPVNATVNAFRLKWSSRSVVYHYAPITPEWSVQTGKEVKISAEKSLEIIRRMQSTVYPRKFPVPGASDGKASLFSTMRYSFVTEHFTVPYDAQVDPRRRPKNVRVKVTFVQEVNIGLLRNLVTGRRDNNTFQRDNGAITAMNMLNLFVQAQPRQGGNLIQGRSFYMRPTRPDRSDAIMSPFRLWQGFFQSVRPTINEIIVNVDTTVGVVLPEDWLENISMSYLGFNDAQALRMNSSDTRFIMLKEFLRGIKVAVEIQPSQRRRPRAIKDLVSNVGAYRFEGRHGQTTVANHFARAYNVTIQPGDLGVRIGQHELFPIRFCKVEAQLYKSKLQSPKYIKAMLDFMPRYPEDRLQTIRQSWGALGHSTSEFLRGAGISIDPSPMMVEGRVLDPPTIRYGAGDKVRINLTKRGVWDALNKQFKEPQSIKMLLVINMTESSTTNVMKAFVADLCSVMRERGMNIEKCTDIKEGNPQGNIDEILHHHGTTYRPDLTLVLLKDNAPGVYQAVKRFGDIKVGVATQCVRWNKKIFEGYSTRNCNQYHNNLVMKINAKLGGLNHTASHPLMDHLANNQAMVIGADVSHPAPGSSMPSTAALVSSWDKYACHYFASTWVQHPRAEIIQELTLMLEQALERFKAANRVLPKSIYFFRDGVSEGEFEKVRQYELEVMKAYLQEKYTREKYPHRPAITFIVVGKRHHFRFFPDARDTMTDKSKNCPSGFVVDKNISHPIYQDFYLVSQAGLKGTSTPGHYTVLEDENLENNGDRLQQLAYSLCHCYARCTRSVKIPAPVYYADLVCGRARFHYNEQVFKSDDVTMQSGEEFPIDYFKSKFSQARTSIQKRGMYFV
ncbi:argonaute-like protein [Moniliophthora roreri MCA 2997]|uniref:Argonaute-like protein n=2 Tax=Moniliophthora roreri TaxID=221103 RepID=V2X3C8_MONRO|nr:argonaute-like protein [Moniliophthora roreri MCA 2997]